MKKYSLLLLFVVFSILFSACGDGDKVPLPEGYHGVSVLETFDASSYTYARVKEGDKEMWVAVAQMPLKPGDSLYYTNPLEMKDFKSSATNRTFDVLYMVQDVSTTHPAMIAGHGNTGDSPMPGGFDHPKVQGIERQQIKVEKYNGGITIEELFKNPKQYEGKTVKIRGIVTKFTPDIMNANWLHLQDGTGTETGYDLTVVTNDKTEMGKLIVIEGKVFLNRDLGAGYQYPVLIEEAAIIE
ncbi:hypothetical protein BAC3_02381 [uncultured bacterium]|nr:hypothetical protein BAC3_02381 [uncultured bacterium]